jgi:hypothetical protein
MKMSEPGSAIVESRERGSEWTGGPQSLLAKEESTIQSIYPTERRIRSSSEVIS